MNVLRSHQKMLLETLSFPLAFLQSQLMGYATDIKNSWSQSTFKVMIWESKVQGFDSFRNSTLGYHQKSGGRSHPEACPYWLCEICHESGKLFKQSHFCIRVIFQVGYFQSFSTEHWLCNGLTPLLLWLI